MTKSKLEKIADIELQMAQLENQKKQLLQQYKEQERKDRTKRLCKRMGLFESMLPDTITLTDDLFKSFLEKTIASEHSRRILDGLTAQSDSIIPGNTGMGTGRFNRSPPHTRRAHLYTLRVSCGLPAAF